MHKLDREIALILVKEWREMQAALELLSMRNEIICSAYEAGFSKTEIHRLSSVARSTIDRILMHPFPATRAR